MCDLSQPSCMMVHQGLANAGGALYKYVEALGELSTLF